MTDAELARIRADYEAARRQLEAWNSPLHLTPNIGLIGVLLAEVERLRADAADAERFRWLCSQSEVCLHVPGQGFTDCDRATIDDSAGEDATWLAK